LHGQPAHNEAVGKVGIAHNKIKNYTKKQKHDKLNPLWRGL